MFSKFSLLKIFILTLSLHSFMSNSSTLINSIDINTSLNEKSDTIIEKLFYNNKLFIISSVYPDYTGSGGSENLYMLDPQANTSKLIAINISFDRYDDQSDLKIYNDKLYFAANAGGANSLGEELYQYDIEKDSLQIVSDLSTGNDLSNFDDLTIFNNKLYFRAYNNSDRQLYEYDSLTDSTRLVPNQFYKYPSDLIEYNNKLYFNARTEDYNYMLLEFDSNTDTTRIVEDRITPNHIGIIYNNKLIFTAWDSNTGGELYEYDSVTDTTRLVSDINVGKEGSDIKDFIIYNNKLYFTAFNQTVGRELYEYDSLTSKVRLIEDINPSTSDDYISDFTVYNNKLYFTADNGINGYELYVYDNATDKSTLVGEINEGENHSSLRNFVVYNNKLYFSAYNDATGHELYEYDDRTNQIKIVFESPESYFGPSYLLVGGSTLFFDIRGELFKFNQLTNVINAQCVICIVGGSEPNNVTEYNQKLYFSADNGTHGNELLAYNKVTQTVELIADINPGVVGSEPTNLYVFDKKLYFSANNGTNGEELHVYDDQTGLVTMVADINLGRDSSNPILFTADNEKLYFFAFDGTNNRVLFEYHEATGTVPLVSDITIADDSRDLYVSSLFVYNQKLYFTGDNGTSGFELFVYDKVTKTAMLAADINPGLNGSEPREFIEYKGFLYFSADNGTNGDELYKFDDVTNIASLVVDNYDGYFNHTTAGPRELTVYNNKLYYRGYGKYQGYELFEYDGKTNKVRLVKDILPGRVHSDHHSGFLSSYPSKFTVYKNKLYFHASAGNGTELIQYDSLSDTVSLVSDINTGNINYDFDYPGYYEPPMIVHDDKMFFSATNDLIGLELFTLYDDWQPDPNLDTDGDGIPDVTDLDDDNDGIPDVWETAFGLDPLDAADALLDADNDGLSNLFEYQSGSNPQNGNEDADGDGFSNFEEHLVGSDPLNKNDIPPNINSWIGILLNSQKPSQLNKH